MALIVTGDLASNCGTEISVQANLDLEGGGNFLSELGFNILLEEQPEPPDNANAESYLYVFEADKYWENRNDTVWAGLTLEAKEAALRQATARLDACYCWEGRISCLDQALAFPRSNTCDKEGRINSNLKVPKAIKHALAELAYYAATGKLDVAVLPPDLSGGGNIKREEIDEALNVEYFKPADMIAATQAIEQPQFPWIDKMLDYAGLIKCGPASAVHTFGRS